MAQNPGTGAGSEREQAAAYLAEMTSQLGLVAGRHGFDALAYLLDMAHLEAKGLTRKQKPSDKGMFG